MLRPVIAFIIAYLLGSISTGALLSRLHGEDIRSKGSGNIGATNVLRVMGKKYGALTLAGDMLKGILAVLIARLICGPALFYGLLASLGAVVGHNFPIFFGFKGGKGIATSFGSLLFVVPIPMLGCFLVFLITVAISRYVSLGSILAAASFPIFCALVIPFELRTFLLVLLMAALAIWRHKANIKRLIRHEENKLSFHKK